MLAHSQNMFKRRIKYSTFLTGNNFNLYLHLGKTAFILKQFMQCKNNGSPVIFMIPRCPKFLQIPALNASAIKSPPARVFKFVRPLEVTSLYFSDWHLGIELFQNNSAHFELKIFALYSSYAKINLMFRFS